MASRKIRIGILGAGAMGAEHAGAYAQIAEAEVTSVFARDPDRARSVAELCGARPHTDAYALIEDPTLDAIDVCLPSELHHRFVIPALDHAKHVFCETPLALALDEARRMREAARRAGRLLQVGLLMRSVAPYAHLKAAVTSGAHGRLLSLSTWRLGSYLRAGAPDHKAHYSDPSTELMTFDFDVAGWLLGAPTRLYASAARHGGETPGEISALLSYPDGRQATIAASGLMPRGHPFTVGFRALFEGAVFELHNSFGDGPPDSRFTVSDDARGPRDVAVPGWNPYQAELQRFVDCIAGRAEPELLDVDRAIEALTLSTATQRSLAEGGQITVGGVA
ncbi:MAG TPA: Gfo/Idh/MocA family oxidoreductase [Caulobacteraceae bacterium]